MVIGDYCGRRALYSPDTLAVVDYSTTPPLRLNWAELDKRVSSLVAWLENKHIQRGDRIGLLAPNGVHYLELFFAAGRLGALFAPGNWRLHWREDVEIFRKIAPKVFFYASEFENTIDNARKALPEIETWIQLDASSSTRDHTYNDILSMPPSSYRNDDVQPEDPACLLLTGGTTGCPKAALISHKQIAWNTLNTIIHDLNRDDVYLNIFPMFHTGGLFVYTLPLLILGGRVILTPRFDPAEVLRIVEKEKVSVFAGVPTMFEMMANCPDWNKADLHRLRFCTSGGSPLPIPLIERYRDEKGIRFKQGFGMTEFGPGCFALAPEDALTHAGSIGRPNFFIDARIVDDNNNEVDTGKVGELVLRGPSGFSGYFGEKSDAAATWDEEGFFHTGDLARRDEQHYYYIVDRKKDMFISGGENVYPAEIEAVLAQHPDIEFSAVIGIHDERWGEVGAAFITAKPNRQLEEEEIRAFLRDRLARYKVPKYVRIKETLPLSGAGKILKTRLKEEFEEE